MKLISLYTGAGGLDLGLEAAGFESVLCVEEDEHARKTLERNRPGWNLLVPGNIYAHKPADVVAAAGVARGDIDLLAGGPPCQPFSKAAYWVNGDTARLSDPRAKTLRAFLSIAEAFLPRVILLENVDGLSYRNKEEAIRSIKRRLRAINKKWGTAYRMSIMGLDAADYGVPQKRQRKFLVIDRDGRAFEEPKPTHGAEEPYTTAWDAIGDLEGFDQDLKPRGKWAGLLSCVPEGSNYQWFTDRGGGPRLFGYRTKYWSFLLKLAKDRPSWTISATNGPATGPFHWANRMLSERELCRIQTFPDNYEIVGSLREVRRQVGNAVPPLLAEIVGRSIRAQLLGGPETEEPLQHSVRRRSGRTGPEPPKRLPKRYRKYVGTHDPHPGTGKGPRALGRANEEEMVT